MNHEMATLPSLDMLDGQPDEALRTLIRHAQAILEARDLGRKKQALDDIRRIAKEHGLDLAVKKPGRKRGRPPKAAPAGP
jgi:hypothetical protein